MKASDLIQELKMRIALYGDCEVRIRLKDDDADYDLTVTYGDDEADRIVVSNQVDLFVCEDI